MNPLTMLLITFAAVAVLVFGWLLILGLARAAARQWQEIDEGESFGGDYVDYALFTRWAAEYGLPLEIEMRPAGVRYVPGAVAV